MIGRSMIWLAPLALLASVASCTPTAAPDSTVTVRSALDSTVVVTVLDGAGVPQIGVEVMAVKTNGSIEEYADTSSSGQATFSLPANSYRFMVNEDGSDFFSGPVGHCVTPSCTTAELTISRVDVTVVDTNGAPLVGHLIWWESSQGDDGGYVETAANGHAIIATPAGSYRFIDYVNGYDFASGASGHCVVPSPCSAVTITETIPVAVTVTNTLGVPQPNLTVAWENAQGEQDGWIDTTASGVALLSVPPGSYRFAVNVSGSEFTSGPPNHCLVPGCVSASISISSPVTVTVTDTAGAPITGKVVSWVNASGDSGNGTQTNASGVSTVVPPPESVRFRVTVDGTQFFSGATVHCSQPGCTSATISVSEPTVVTVVDGAGAPISGRAVTPLSDEGITSGNKTTNTSGQATFRLPFAHWRFRATCSGTSEQFFSGDAGHCYIPGACLTAKIKMPCGQCTGQTNGAACDDQNPCTGSSSCQSQKCTGASPVSCSASDQCHDVGACGAETGTCSNPPKANTSACDDNNACTQSDTCQSGVCTGANPVTCTALDQCHLAGSCNPATGYCSDPIVTTGTLCNDGNQCTVGETCQAGVCQPGAATACSGGTYYPPITELSFGMGPTATAVNEAGDVVGYSGFVAQNPKGFILRAFRYTAGGGVVALTQDGVESAAWGLNEAGVVAGSANLNAMIVSPANDVTTYPWALGLFGVNDVGHFTGYAATAVRYAGTGEPQGLGVLPGDYDSAAGLAIDNLGGVVGVSYTTVGRDYWTPGHAILFTDLDGLQDLNDLALPGSPFATLSQANATNGTTIVGHGFLDANNIRGFRYKAGVVDAIEGIPPYNYQTTAKGINQRGDIVGRTFGNGGDNSRAFIYTNEGQMFDLNDFVDPASQWVLQIAEAINDHNVVVGTGTRNGVVRAFKIDLANLPCPASTNQCEGPGVRDPQTGACSWPQLATGTPCNDNNLCSQTDTCQAGTCVGGNPVVCTAQDQCHLGTCAPATGVCSFAPKPDGAICNDGQACTQTETCQAGSCQAPPTAQAPTILNLAVEHLGDLGGDYANPSDINASGQTVGASRLASGESRAFLRNAGGPMVDLGSQLSLPSPHSAAAINDAGTVAGYMTATDGAHAYRYSASGGLEDLGRPGDGSNFSDVFGPGPTDFVVFRGAYGSDVNAQGQIAGYFTTDDGQMHGFRYTDGIFEDIQGFAGGATRAFAINAFGVVGGTSWVPGTPVTNDARRLGHAMIFQDAIVGPVDLNDLIDPLLGWTLYGVFDMSGDFVVGTGELNGVLRAFRLRLSTGAIDDISAGWEGRSFGQGVNSQGDVVGYGHLDAAEVQLRGFVYSDRFGFKNLNDMIESASGWELRTASAINDSGDIVGWGYLGGAVSAYRVRMPPGQAATCKARNTCGGDVGGDAICLYSDGVVETSPGHFVAVFGYDNASATSVQPTTNQVLLDGSVVANPNPAPPATLAPGTHTGAFLPRFEANQQINQQVSWTVNGETVTASATSPRLQAVPIGNGGLGVVVAGQRITIIPDPTDPGAVLGFEEVGLWSSSLAGGIVGLAADHTQGSHSLEVAAQGQTVVTSVKLSSLHALTPLALVDVLLPTQQANPSWFGSIELIANAPSLGILNASLGQVELTGLPLATWQTLAFQLSGDHVSLLSGEYGDLTFSIGLNVPSNQTGHYLLDNLRFVSPVVPTLLGVAPDSAGVLKAVFAYAVPGGQSVNIPYGLANALSDETGLLLSPRELPPEWFVPGTSTPFVATLGGTQLTWRVGTATATASDTMSPLPTQPGPNGTRVAILPGGSLLNLDVDPEAADTLDNMVVASDTSYTLFDQVQDESISGGGEVALGPTSAGTLPGMFRVTDDGAAEYKVPLDLPAGRNGVQPSLTLVYNSRRRGGVLGAGWALDGIHRISRCKRPYGQAADRGLDPAAVTYTDSDDFCIDDEPLVKVGDGEYRTKHDSQSKIVVTSRNASGPLTFAVYLRNGLIQYYGLDDSTRGLRNRIVSINQQVPGGTNPVSFSNVTREWYLAKTVDRFGNTMTNTYRFDPVETLPGVLISGPGLPETITYTSNPSTGRSATKTISFGYDADPSSAGTKFDGGVPIHGAGYILTSISITAPNPVVPSLIGKYKLTYLTPAITGTLQISKRPLLRRIQRCDANDVCMAPTTFGWSFGSYAFSHRETTIDDFVCPTCGGLDNCSQDAQARSRVLIAADINGDGREDLMYRPIIGNGFCGQNPRPSTAFKVRLGGPSGFGPAIETGLPDITNEEFDHKVFPPLVIFDINGDGKTDVASLQEGQFFGEQGAPVVMFWRLFQSTGGGSFQRLPPGLTDQQFLDPAFNPEAEAVMNWKGHLFPVDTNGDGLVDLARPFLAASDPDECVGTLRIRTNTNGVLGPYASMPFSAPWINFTPGLHDCHGLSGPFPRGLFIGDIDGDGRTEVVMSGDPSSSYGVRSGTGGFGTILTNIPKEPAEYRTFDFNGDGLVDVIRKTGPLDNQVFTVWANTGNGFMPYTTTTNKAVLSLFYAVDPGFIDDINGDGQQDVFLPGCHGAPAEARISNGSGGFQTVSLNLPPAYSLSETGQAPWTYCPVAFMDVNGDGQKDVVQAENGSNALHIYLRGSMRPDRLLTIDNGIRDHVAIEYGNHNAVESCQYPNLCRGRNVEVVTGYTVNEGEVASGQDPTTHFSMQYTGPVADAMGAGWFGFSSIEAHNDRTHVRTLKQYDLSRRVGNWRPLAGRPTFERTSYPISGTNRIVTRQRTTVYSIVPSNGSDANGPHFVVPQMIDEREIEQGPGQGFDPDSAQRWTVQNLTYDSFGNLKKRETQGMRLPSLDVVDYGITNDAEKWLIGKIDSVTTRSTFGGETDQSLITFQVHPTTGATMGRTVQPGDPKLQLTTMYGRNPDGLIDTITDVPIEGAARRSRVSYDAVEGAWPATFRNVLGHVTRLAYHPGLGVLGSVRDPNNVRTRWQCDGFGRRKALVEDNGASYQVQFSRPQSTSKGLITAWTNSAGRSGAIMTDTNGREIRRTGMAFDGIHRTTTARVYDAGTGKPQFISRPFGATSDTTTADPNKGWTLSYDELGRLISMRPPTELATELTYTGFKVTENVGGNQKGYRVEDAAGHVTTSVLIEPTSSAPNGEIVTTYDYGAFGRLKKVHQPGGGTLSMDYDHLGQVIGVTDPDAGHRSTDFNAFGEIVGEQAPGQSAITYLRDRLGRVEFKMSGEGTTTFRWDRAPNGIGMLEDAMSPSGVITGYRYLPNGLVSRSTVTVGGSSYSFDWSYDASGRAKTITYPDIGAGSRFEVELSYGADGHQVSVQVPGTTPFWQKTAVRDDGQTFTEAFNNGLSSLFDSNVNSGRVTHISTGSGPIVQVGDGTGRKLQNTLQSLGYQYYPDGKLQFRTDDELVAFESFVYDNVDRITDWSIGSTETAVHFGYDDTGNLKSRTSVGPGGTVAETYQYGENGAGLHALTSGPAGIYGYDASGRQTSRPGVPTITFTSFDLPIRVDGSNPVEFKYDAAGARVLKQTASGAVLSISSLYERHTENGTVKHVFYLPGDGKVVGQINCNAQAICDTPIFFHRDRIGTVDTITRQGLLGRQKRDPFGRAYSPGSFSEPGSLVSLGFVGQAEDDEVGLVNMNHRLYDATVGRFVSPDPFVKNGLFGPDYNRYAYARNNPLSYVDPSGLLSSGIDLHGLPGQEYVGPPKAATVIEGEGGIDEETGFHKANDKYWRSLDQTITHYPDGTVQIHPSGPNETTVRARLGTPTVSKPSVVGPQTGKPPLSGPPAPPPSTFAKIANTFVEIERLNFALLPGPLGMMGDQAIDFLHSAACLAAGCDADGVIEGAGPERSTVQTGIDVVTVLGGVLPLAGEVAGGVGGVRVLQSCFTGDTKVVTREGAVPIAKVEVGDEVWSFDEETGEWAWKEVTKKFVHAHEGLVYRLTLGDELIEVTGNHPICVASGSALATRPVPVDIGSDPLKCGEGGRWVDASDVLPGDRLVGADGGVIVGTETSYEASLTVYNISVADSHTYAVSADGLLVHNKAAVNPVYVAQQLAKGLPAALKCAGVCDKFAGALRALLQKAGVSGELIRVEAGPGTRVYSDTLGALSGPTNRAGAGFHEAIRIGDTVFDNLRPGGIPVEQFFDDLGGALFRASGGRIGVTGF